MFFVSFQSYESFLWCCLCGCVLHVLVAFYGRVCSGCVSWWLCYVGLCSVVVVFYGLCSCVQLLCFVDLCAVVVVFYGLCGVLLSCVGWLLCFVVVCAWWLLFVRLERAMFYFVCLFVWDCASIFVSVFGEFFGTCLSLCP